MRSSTQVNPCAVALNISSVLSAVKGTLWTDLDWNDAPALAALATKIKTKNVRTYVLSPSNGFNENVIPDVGSQTVLKKYQAVVKKGLNGVPSAYASGSGRRRRRRVPLLGRADPLWRALWRWCRRRELNPHDLTATRF